MKLRSKLFVVLSPLLIALGIGGWLASFATDQLARSAHAILTDNYRSVLAAQRMKETIERIDSGAMFVQIGHRQAGIDQARENRNRFEEELRVEENNITEAGEKEAAATVRALWKEYQSRYDAFLAPSEAGDLSQLYFDRLYPPFVAIKDQCDVILAMNQDAMMRKSEAADKEAIKLRFFIAAFVAGACGFAALLSTFGISLVLRPLAVVAQTTRRIAQGDMQARARVEGSDEVADLAKELNEMAEKLAAYQRSSLGELLEAQQAAQAAVDSFPDPVIVLTAENGLLHSNKSAQKLLSVEEGGASRFIDEALERAVQEIRKHVEGGRGAIVARGLEHAIRATASATAVYYLPHAMPLYGMRREIVGTTVVLQDVTRLVRFDELKNDMVATVAHELRTPLTSLQMALHLCAEEVVGPLNEKQADMLFAAREDCTRLQATVNELLDFSRIQAGSIRLEVRPIEPSQLITAACEAQKSNAALHQVELRVELSAELNTVQVDPDRMHLAFDNILSNAIRYAPRESEVLIRVFPHGSDVRFEIHDLGPGVPEQYRSMVFERYFQVPNHPAGRAGLGLFIAREVVQAHGGSIGVEARDSVGSIFWFQIPSA